MSNPTYKGPGQPMPSVNDGITGWLGGFLGGATAPAYKTAPPAPSPRKPCLELSRQAPATQNGDACELLLVDPSDGDAVIPVGPGPITIVIQPRA